MDIKATAGSSMGNQVNFARAQTKDFSLKYPKLLLTLDIKSQGNSAKKYLSKTPIKFISEAIKIIDIKGELRSKITLNVGLSDADKSEAKVNGQLVLDPKTSKVGLPFAKFSHLKGIVKYNQHGLVNSLLSAEYRGQNLSVNILQAKSKDQPLRLKVKGNFPASGIGDFLDSPWDRLFKGLTAFQSETQFYNGGRIKEIITSDLQGLSVSLPGDLGKDKLTSTAFELVIDSNQQHVASINWNGVTGQWFWQKDAVSNSSGGDFYIRQKKPAIAQELSSLERLKTGIRINANLEYTDFSEWMKLYDKLGFSTDKKSANTKTIDTIALNIEELKLPLTKIEKVEMVIKQLNGKDWIIDGLSKQGDFSLALFADSPWEINLKNISLTLDESLFETKKENKQTKKLGTKVALQASHLYEMNLLCNKCIVQNRDLGDIRFKLRRINNGVHFSTRAIKPQYHDLSLQGHWADQSNGKSNTHLRFDIKSPDVGLFFDSWDLNAAIKDSKARLIADVSWNDAPWNFEPSSFDGGMQIALGKGYLSEISDEKGRLFSLFNLNSLVRKLTFDFKDVYKKGFFFDSIKGSFRIENGEIITQNTRIKGNVADVKLYGGANLATKEFEQYAVVTPHLTSSLPVLAAWAIEPTTGIIVFLLNKIMQPAVEVATRIDYRIYGSFDDVQVEQINTSKRKIALDIEAKESLPSEKTMSKNKDNSKDAIESGDSSDKAVDNKLIPDSQPEPEPETETEPKANLKPQ
ncbi:MAG: AsmA-like C-terminal region-containing protein [Enterobacterales bacterium]|nr:AsmA-like C-terminal region-containing protein [Enterobacterales bacterium]